MKPISRRTFLGQTAAVISLRSATAGGQAAGSPNGRRAAVQQHGLPPDIKRDALGLIVQSDGDGGDTAQREGFVWFALFIRRKLKLPDPPYLGLRLSFSDTIDLLEMERSGMFRRHPTQHNDVGDFSRDQQIPLVAAMGAWNLRQPLERLWAQTEARGRVCQNGDAVGPDHFNLFQRARGSLLDIDPFGELQLRAMVASFAIKNPGDVSDDLNHIVALGMAALVSPTKTSRLATKEYLTTRPHTYGSFLTRYYTEFGRTVTDLGLQERRIQAYMDRGETPDADCSSVLGALRWYFRPETGGHPAIVDLYKPLVDEYLVREGEQ